MGPVLLCAPPRHIAMQLNFLAQGKSLPPAGIELGTFGLQRQRFESATLATAPARHIDSPSFMTSVVMVSDLFHLKWTLSAGFPDQLPSNSYKNS